MNNTNKKKQAKTRTSEKAIVRAIEETDNLEEARRIQRWLALLKQKADVKVQNFEEIAQRDGLSYKGKDAKKCPDFDHCGNSFHPEGKYYGVCAGCPDGKEIFCNDCLWECVQCGERWCIDCKDKCCYCVVLW